MTLVARLVAGILIAGLVFTGPAFSCSLAEHDWELVWSRNFALSAPLIPAAELDLCGRSLPQGVPKTVWWFVPKPLAGFPGLLWLTRGQSLLSGITWRVFSADAPLPATPPNLEPPVYLRTDQSRVRLFLFRDRKASEPCWQFAALQDGRIRGIWPSKSFPWVEERIARSWFQVIFLRWPLPGNILTCSVAASLDNRQTLLENVRLVKSLVDRGILRLRSNAFPEPEVAPFPLDPAP